MQLTRVLMAAAILTATSAGWCDTSQTRKKLDAATAEVTYMSFERALPIFLDVMRKNSEGSDEWQQATFGAATCQQQAMPSGDYSIGEAKRLFELLLTQSPDSKYASRAMMNLGRIAELVDYSGDVSDRETARQWYSRAMQKATGTTIESEAVLRIAATYVQTYQKDEILKGLSILRDFVETRPMDPLASAMWQYMGETYYYPLQDYARSLDCYKKADAIGLLEEGREGPVYWRMAVIADRYLKDRDTAITYYRKIITKTPTSGKAYEAQLALKKMGIEPPRIELFDMMATQASESPATTAPPTSAPSAQGQGAAR